MFNLYKRDYFNCDCSYIGHTFCIDTYECADDKEINLAVHIQMGNYFPWYRRVWVAIKYIFNVNHDEAHWDVCLLETPEELNRLYKTIKYVKEKKEEYEALPCQEKEDTSKQEKQTDGSSI